MRSPFEKAKLLAFDVFGLGTNSETETGNVCGLTGDVVPGLVTFGVPELPAPPQALSAPMLSDATTVLVILQTIPSFLSGNAVLPKERVAERLGTGVISIEAGMLDR